MLELELYMHNIIFMMTYRFIYLFIHDTGGFAPFSSEKAIITRVFASRTQLSV